jgi:L-alanine-DL-glutamate epimerase-like enolase superfamily enzyme
MPKLVSFETWVCVQQRDPLWSGQGHPFAKVGKTIVVKLTDEDGFEGIGTCIGEWGTRAPLAFLHEYIAPLVVGRDIYDREAIWQELWHEYRRAAFFPIHVTGPVDVALWDLAAKRAHLPLYKYIGARRTSLPVYYSSPFMDAVDDYVGDVAVALKQGYRAYKVHSKENLDVFTAVREAAGPSTVLMADPAADWTYEQALRVGRHLERLDYTWLEEPFLDWNLEKYRRLTASLDIPIAGTEATVGAHWGVAQAILQGAVDIVRADVSWKAGITGTLKIAHLAESFGMNVELHSAMMGPMDMANLHVACAIPNTEWFELHVPNEILRFPMKEPYPIQHGVITVPEGDGLGITIDWDSVDNDTYEYRRWDEAAKN